jgi:hypothetical protein
MRPIALDVETIALLIEHRERCAAVRAKGESELDRSSLRLSADPARERRRPVLRVGQLRCWLPLIRRWVVFERVSG